MKDKRMDKLKKHDDIYINDLKFKVLSCKICDEDRKLIIKTKVFGQCFPHNGQIVLVIPSENVSRELSLSFEYMGSNPTIEEWVYRIN